MASRFSTKGTLADSTRLFPCGHGPSHCDCLKLAIIAVKLAIIAGQKQCPVCRTDFDPEFVQMDLAGKCFNPWLMKSIGTGGGGPPGGCNGGGSDGGGPSDGGGGGGGGGSPGAPILVSLGIKPKKRRVSHKTPEVPQSWLNLTDMTVFG